MLRPHYVFKFALIFYTLVAITACKNLPKTTTQASEANIQRNLLQSPEKIRYWNSKIPSHAEKIQMQFALQQNSRVEFTFSEFSNSASLAQIRISLSDQNCSNGHLAHIEYQPKTGQLYNYYIDKEIPWNQNVNLDVSWHENGTATILLDTHKVDIEISEKIKHIHITSKINATNFSTIKY